MHNKAILIPAIAALMVTNACEDVSSDPEDVTTRAYGTEVLAPAFTDRIDSVDVTVSDSDAMVVAFDARGAAIGSLALWVDDSGVTWLAADFPDGGMLVSADPESEALTRDADMALAVIAARTEVMAVYLDPTTPQTFEGWAGCGVAVVVAAGACASTLGWGWLLCGVGAANATCECIKAANDGKANYPCGKEKQKEKGK